MWYFDEKHYFYSPTLSQLIQIIHFRPYILILLLKQEAHMSKIEKRIKQGKYKNMAPITFLYGLPCSGKFCEQPKQPCRNQQSEKDNGNRCKNLIGHFKPYKGKCPEKHGQYNHNIKAHYLFLHARIHLRAEFTLTHTFFQPDRHQRYLFLIPINGV